MSHTRGKNNLPRRRTEFTMAFISLAQRSLSSDYLTFRLISFSYTRIVLRELSTITIYRIVNKLPAKVCELLILKVREILRKVQP